MAALVLMFGALAAPVAMAYPDPPPSPVVDPEISTKVAPASATQASTGVFTGSDITGVVVIGALVVGTGFVVMRAAW